ncbi:MAG: hypothetical protein JHC34_00520 [Acidobacteria bacterium]|jgi:hypothetical protein|nr:hypothetical protein [Acidobacteriota bacterium]
MGLKEQLRVIQEQYGNTKQGLDEGVKAIVAAVTMSLKVKPDEVALLVLTTTGNTLKFVWPEPLYKSNAVLPAMHKNAVASAVLQARKGKVDNRMAESRHLKFFENVKGLETSGVPIQKMVALPVMAGDSPIGVVEVSRKGRTAEEAGPNFTPEDAQKLLALAKEFAAGLAALVPQPFI